MKNIRIFYFVSILGTILSLSGCMFARLLVTEELMLVRGGAFRATAARVAITEEVAAMRTMSRLRIKPGTLNKPVLYLPEAGINKPLFEILNQSTIRRISTGEVFSLPFRIFRVNGLAKAELRSGPGVSFKLYKTLPKDRFVLVRDEVAGWYKVQVDELIGWIAIAALVPAVKESSESNVTYTDIECYNCNSQGSNECIECNQSGIEDCPSCNGKGNHKCTICDGSGQINCLICKDKNKEGCPSCRGIGQLECKACKAKGLFDCSICHSSGKIPCAVCDGSLHTKCYFCFGTTKVQSRVEKK